jgi:predicted nucleic acid-binding protein
VESPGPSVSPPALVVDSSVLIGGLLEGQESPLARRVVEWLAAGETQAVVPAIFPVEAANALLMALRRGRIEEPVFEALLELLSRLPLRVEESGRALVRIGERARVHGLTFYDACYLDAAVQYRIGLATLDKALARAAKAEGVLYA